MIAGQTCLNCAAYSALPQPECRAKPPRVFIVSAPQGPVTWGVFPPTRPEHWCRKWCKEEPRVTLS